MFVKMLTVLFGCFCLYWPLHVVEARSMNSADSQASTMASFLSYPDYNQINNAVYQERVDDTVDEDDDDWDCTSKEVYNCLRAKLIAGINRLAKQRDIRLANWITLKKVENNSEVVEQARSSSAIDETSILDKLQRFFQERSLQLNFSGLQMNSDEAFEDGRGKKGKLNALALYPLMMGSFIIPLALGTLLLLAGKALIMAKIALALTFIFGLKKLMGGGGGSEHLHNSAYQIPSAMPYRRSFEAENSAAAFNNYPYRAYIPLPLTQSTNQQIADIE